MRVKPEIHQVHDHLHMPLGLHVATHHAERPQRFTVLAEKPGDDGVEGRFAGCQATGVTWIKTEFFTAVLQG